MIRAVFFDVANTLLNKPELYLRMDAVLVKHGFSIDMQTLVERHRLLSEALDFPDTTSKEFYSYFNSRLLEALGIVPTKILTEELFQACTYLSWAIFDDVSCLSQINLPKGIISNWDSSLQDKLSRHIPVDFKWILGSMDSGLRKPALEFYAMILDTTGFAAEDILYVGDSIKLDIYPALQLGMNAVLIDRNNLYPQSQLKRVRRLDEIVNRFL
jgi:FMN phosphatase YigB (HAD superfamily)